MTISTIDIYTAATATHPSQNYRLGRKRSGFSPVSPPPEKLCLVGGIDIGTAADLSEEFSQLKQATNQHLQSASSVTVAVLSHGERLLAYAVLASDDIASAQATHQALGCSADWWILDGSRCTAFAVDGTQLHADVASLSLSPDGPFTVATRWREQQPSRLKRRQAAIDREAKKKRRQWEGWPQGWRERDIARWEARGSTVFVASAWAGAGWTQQEALTAFTKKQPITMPPAASPVEQRIFGPSLFELLHEGGLPTPEGTVVTGRSVAPDGSQSYWYLHRDDFQFYLTTSGPTECLGTSHTIDLGGASLTEVRVLDSLLVLSVDQISHVRALPEFAAEVFRRVTVSDQSSVARPWQYRVEPALADEDAELSALLDLTFRHRWATLNGVRLTAVKLAGEQFVPIAFDLDEQVLAFDDPIASFDWHSEAGGAPISWDGGGSISEFWGALIRRVWGDLDQSLEVVERPDGEDALGRYLAEWVIDAEQEFPAALALEGSSFLSALPGFRRDFWEEALDELTASVTFRDLHQRTEIALRQVLRDRSAVYRAIQDLPVHPTSAVALRLESALADFLADGVLRPLLGGEWLAEPSRTDARDRSGDLA